MNIKGENHHFFKNLQDASDHIIHLISKFIGVNTLCVASNDKHTSDIFSAFHRNEALFEAGTRLSFFEAY
jgi:rsbT co-antagonist protein RsbR